MRRNSLMSDPDPVVDSQYQWLRDKGYGELVCIFTRLRLSNYYLKRILKERDKADQDRSGTVSIQEFFSSYELTFLTPLAKRAFAAFDLDGSGELDFGEFAVSIWNFCTMPLQGLARLFFEIYDSDKSGMIDDVEFRQLMMEAYGGETRMTNLNLKLLESMQQKKVKFSASEFCDFVIQNPGTFWPVVTLQRELRNVIIGVDFWKKVTKERLTNSTAASRTLRFLKECFDPSGYVDSFHIRVNFARSLFGYIIRGMSEEDHVSNSYVTIKINGIPRLEKDSRFFKEHKHPKYNLWYIYTDLHVDDRITWELWHWNLPFDFPGKKPKPLFSRPLGCGSFTIRECLAMHKQENINMEIESLDGSETIHGGKVNFSFEITLRAPLKDFTKEEAVVSIGNKRRQVKSVKKGQIVPQSEIEEFKAMQHREKQDWKIREKKKKEAVIAHHQQEGNFLQAEILAYNGDTNISLINSEQDDIDIEDLLSGGNGRASKTKNQKKKPKSRHATKQKGPSPFNDRNRPLH